MREATRDNAGSRVNIRPPRYDSRSLVSIIIVVAVHFVSIRRAVRSRVSRGPFLRRRRGQREEDEEEDDEEGGWTSRDATWNWVRRTYPRIGRRCHTYCMRDRDIFIGISIRSVAKT